jgi:hypothetical protein
VVDGLPRQVLDGADQRAAALLGGLGLDLLRFPYPLGDQPLGRERLGRGVRGVDLVAAVAGDVHVGVAGDGERGGGPTALRDVQQDDRVGVQHARVGAAREHPLHLGRQRPALRVGAAVHADEQDVEVAAVPAARDDVGGGDPGRHIAV